MRFLRRCARHDRGLPPLLHPPARRLPPSASQLHIQRSERQRRGRDPDEREPRREPPRLGKGTQGGDAYKSVEGTFADLMIHQPALPRDHGSRAVKSRRRAVAEDDRHRARGAGQAGEGKLLRGPWRFKELCLVVSATKHTAISTTVTAHVFPRSAPDFAGNRTSSISGTVDSATESATSHVPFPAPLRADEEARHHDAWAAPGPVHQRRV